MKTKAVELKDVSIKFNELSVLHDINLTIKENDFMAIIGPNGGGKSTLLKIILGLLKPDTGEVRIFGRKPEDAREIMGYLPQRVSFDHDFPINVYNTVLSGRYHGLFKGHNEADKKAVLNALEDLNMLDLRDRQISRLSGGQLQRVFIARAIVREPKILLMDEPMASIDPEMQKSFYSLLSELKDKITIVLVSHDVGSVSKHVDKIACLNRKLYYHGPVEYAAEGLKKIYKSPVELLTHEIPQRILKDHLD